VASFDRLDAGAGRRESESDLVEPRLAASVETRVDGPPRPEGPPGIGIRNPNGEPPDSVATRGAAPIGVRDVVAGLEIRETRAASDVDETARGALVRTGAAELSPAF